MLSSTNPGSSGPLWHFTRHLAQLGTRSFVFDVASSFLAEVLHYLKGNVVSVSDVVIIFKINYISEYFYCLFFGGQELQYSLPQPPK